MTRFDLHSFCTECGGYRRRMPFGEDSDFWDDGPCPCCGADKWQNKRVVAKYARTGRWPWQWGWVDRAGDPV